MLNTYQRSFPAWWLCYLLHQTLPRNPSSAQWQNWSPVSEVITERDGKKICKFSIKVSNTQTSYANNLKKKKKKSFKRLATKLMSLDCHELGVIHLKTAIHLFSFCFPLFQVLLTVTKIHQAHPIFYLKVACADTVWFHTAWLWIFSLTKPYWDTYSPEKWEMKIIQVSLGFANAF